MAKGKFDETGEQIVDELQSALRKVGRRLRDRRNKESEKLRDDRRRASETDGTMSDVADAASSKTDDRFDFDLDDVRTSDINDLTDAEWDALQGELTDSELAGLLRPTTPTQEIRDAVQNGSGPQRDPLYPDIEVDRLEADHIIPLREIVEMDGFRDLTWEQMRDVVNLRENFWGLSKPINASKGDTSPFDYTGHSNVDKYGELTPEARDLLDSMGEEALEALQKKIMRYLS